MGHNLETLDDADLGWSWLEMRGSEIVIVKVDAGEVESIAAAFNLILTIYRLSNSPKKCLWMDYKLANIRLTGAEVQHNYFYSLSLSLSLSSLIKLQIDAPNLVIKSISSLTCLKKQQGDILISSRPS